MTATASQTDVLAGAQLQAPEALIRKVSESISEVMEQKLYRFSETLDKLSSTLGSHVLRVAAEEQRIADVEDTVKDMVRRLAAAEKKILSVVNGLDDMENRSRLPDSLECKGDGRRADC
ncbi:hypothetical protein CRENBAI_018932 [Crenichthys baileyi]|uniref:Uncharacterized protein n=1 Tax=Crenichthys baileyi TaxID=28760 RepID=A0AAV9SHD6_9TELE